MKLSDIASEVGSATHVASRTLSRWFPTPALIAPPAAGIDISDSSVKWLAFERFGTAYRISTCGEEPLPKGAVESGVLKDAEALTQALVNIRGKLGKITCAHAALPEECAYVFEMQVPRNERHDEALHMIEFEFEGRVPIPPASAVFDFDDINPSGEQENIGVAVFPRELAENYAQCFERSGITLLSLELEARSIARAVYSGDAHEGVSLLIDFGRARSGFAVLKRGIPIFTSTVEVGGDQMTKTLREKLSLSEEDAVTFRNEEGLRSSRAPGVAVVTVAASALAEEVARHYRFWDTRRDERGERMSPVSQVILVGGSANLNGLTDFVAGRVQAPVVLGDVWQHVCDFDEYIPPIDRRHSLQYATAVGLAMRSLEL